MGFVLGVLIAQGLLGKSAMSLDLKGAIVNIPQFTFLLLDQPPQGFVPPPRPVEVLHGHLLTPLYSLLLVDSRPARWLTFLGW